MRPLITAIRTALPALVITLGSAAAAQGQVSCTATTGYHCETHSGCEDDAKYISTYAIEWARGVVTQTTYQNVKYDPEPVSDGTEYSIVNTGRSLKTGEFTVTAVARVGSEAVETLLIGERTYLSSNVSTSGPRIFMMMGTCSGFYRPR